VRSQRWILVAIIAGYGALCGRALTYDFVWDDVAEIERSPAFDGSLAAGLRMTQVERIDPALAHTRGVVLAYDSYRPVLFASYWLEIHAWGRRPGPMHATNLVAGAIGILLAHALARRLLSARLALAATAIFALHPLHVEAVVYISGRGDLFAGVLALATTLLAIRASEAGPGRARAGWIGAAAAGFALSLLAKEACIGLPVAVAAIGWALGARRRDAVIPAVLAAVAVAVVALRAMLIATSSSLALGGAIALLPAVYLDAARGVLLPLDLSTDRPLTAPLAAAWIAVAIAGIAAGAAVGRRGWPARLPPAIAGLVWWGVLIAPSSVAIAATGVVSDRYMYAPLFGTAVALVAALAALARQRPALRRPLVGIAVVWGALLGFVAWQQVAVWSDDETLDTHAVAAAPGSGAAHWRLGNVHAQAGRWDDAISELAAATELDPGNFHALDNLGVALMARRRYAEAEAALVRAVAASPAPSSFRPLYNLGVARLALGQRSAGCAAIRRALAIRPGYAAAADELARSCGP
jgi:tetratricopeptide (TPR) repeat protein